MNQPYYPDLVFSLSELLDNGVIQHAELITELSAASSGEAQLKESLVKISKASTIGRQRQGVHACSLLRIVGQTTVLEEGGAVLF